MSTPGARVREQREARAASLAEQEAVILIRTNGPTQQPVAHLPRNPQYTVCGAFVARMEPLHPLTSVPPSRVCSRCFPSPAATSHRINTWLEANPR